MARNFTSPFAGAGYLSFEDKGTGRDKKYFSEDITQMLHQPVFRNLKLVVLASCHSSLIAPAFSSVPHVISVPDGTAVPDHICNEFSKELYSSLLLDVGVEGAFESASKACGTRVTPWFELHGALQRATTSALLGISTPITRKGSKPVLSAGLFEDAERKPSGESTPQVRAPISYELGNLPDWRSTALVRPSGVYHLRKHITDGLKRGCISHLHVFGPPGAGKSRAAAEACRHMTERGERVTLLGVRFPSSAGSAAYPDAIPGHTAIWRLVASALRLAVSSEAELLRSAFALGDFQKLLLLDGVDAWCRCNVLNNAVQPSLPPAVAGVPREEGGMPSAYPAAAGAGGAAAAAGGSEGDAVYIEDFVERARAQAPGQGMVITTCCARLTGADTQHRADKLPADGLAAADLLMRRLSRPISAHHLVPTMGSADEQRFSDWHQLRAALRRSPALRETGFIPRVIEHLAELLEAAVARGVAGGIEASAVGVAFSAIMQQGPQDHSAGARKAAEPDCGWTEDALALCMNNLRQLPVKADPYSDQHLWLSLQRSQLSEKQAEVAAAHPAHKEDAAASGLLGASLTPLWPSTYPEMAAMVSVHGELAPANVHPAALKHCELAMPLDGVGQWVWLRASAGAGVASQAAVMDAVAAATRVLLGRGGRELSAAHRECIESVLCAKYCKGLPGAPLRSDELVSWPEMTQAQWKAVPLSCGAVPGRGDFLGGWAWMGAVLKVLVNGLRPMWNARDPEVLRGFERLCVAQADFIDASRGSFMLTFSESQPGCVRVMWGVDWGAGSFPVVKSDCTRLLDEFGRQFELGSRRGALANLLQHHSGCVFILPSRVEKSAVLHGLLQHADVGGIALQHQGSLPLGRAVGASAGVALARQQSAPVRGACGAGTGASAQRVSPLLHAPREPSGVFQAVPPVNYNTWPEQFELDKQGHPPPAHRQQNWQQLKHWCQHFAVVPISFSKFLR